MAHSFLSSSPCCVPKGSCNLASAILVELERGSVSRAGCCSAWQASGMEEQCPRPCQPCLGTPKAVLVLP